MSPAIALSISASVGLVFCLGSAVAGISGRPGSSRIGARRARPTRPAPRCRSCPSDRLDRDDLLVRHGGNRRCARSGGLTFDITVQAPHSAIAAELRAGDPSWSRSPTAGGFRAADPRRRAGRRDQVRHAGSPVRRKALASSAPMRMLVEQSNGPGGEIPSKSGGTGNSTARAGCQNVRCSHALYRPSAGGFQEVIRRARLMSRGTRISPVVAIEFSPLWLGTRCLRFGPGGPSASP